MRFLEIKPPPVEESTIDAYGKYAIINFWGVMTGTSITTLLVLIGTGGNILWTIGAAAIAYVVLFVIGYSMFKVERQRYLSFVEEKQHTENELTSKIDALSERLKTIETDKRPHLIGHLQGLRMWSLRDVRDSHVEVQIGFVNQSSTPTTLHNFSLTITGKDKTWTADYPIDSVVPENTKSVFLDKFLNDPTKISKRGRRIEGYLNFEVTGFRWDIDWLEDPEFMVTVTDAFGDPHHLVGWGMWPAKPREFPGNP